MDDDFAEAVLDAVELIPRGCVASYGDIAEFLGRGGPRQVGRVMASRGGAVAWWRVVRADGRPVRGLEDAAWAKLRAEGVPARGDRIEMRRARFDWSRVAPPTGDDPT